MLPYTELIEVAELMLNFQIVLLQEQRVCLTPTSVSQG